MSSDGKGRGSRRPEPQVRSALYLLQNQIQNGYLLPGCEELCAIIVDACIAMHVGSAGASPSHGEITLGRREPPHPVGNLVPISQLDQQEVELV